MLPDHLKAGINSHAWPRQSMFNWLQAQGEIAEAEMLRTFNCGIGMVICVAEKQAEAVLNSLKMQGETAWPIGQCERA